MIMTAIKATSSTKKKSKGQFTLSQPRPSRRPKLSTQAVRAV
jgi:hypothetical protein